MDTPGNVLRTEREKQKRSLKEIARALKIKIEYIRAIEDDNYQLLPAEIYTKAYLRLYSDLLDLESDFILDLYKNQVEACPVEEPESLQEIDVSEYKPILKISPFKKIISSNYKLILIIASLVLIVISAVMFSKNGEEKTVMETVNETKAPEISADKENGKLSLKITATELTWVSVSIDGGKRREWLLRPGEVVTISAFEKFAVKIGNAGGTKITFNNEDIGELGPPGKVVDIVLP